MNTQQRSYNTKIIHNQNLRDYPNYDDKATKKAWIENNLHLFVDVAKLNLNSNTHQDRQNDAFRITQNGMDSEYSSWIDLADAYEGNITYTTKARSTSVGDIIEVDGSRYVVDNCGFIFLGNI